MENVDKIVAYTDYKSQNGIYHTKAYIGYDLVCECKVCINDDNDTWSISAWYTGTSYQHHGYGLYTLKATLKLMYLQLGEPERIEYIWNGSNQYVMDWLEEHFSPVCKLPLAVRKYQDADDWDAHIYVLDKESVFRYLNIKEAS